MWPEMDQVGSVIGSLAQIDDPDGAESCFRPWLFPGADAERMLRPQGRGKPREKNINVLRG
jgi:hypothetical protein